MLDGITVLSESVNELTINDKISAIILCLFLSLLFGVVAWLIMNNVKFGIVFSIFMFIVIMLLTNDQMNKPPYTVYKVTISDEVNFVEFTEKYEVLSQDGKIYEIRERETE